MSINEELKKVRELWNKKWQKYLADNKETLNKFPKDMISFFENMTFISASGDKDNMYLKVSVNGIIYDMKKWSWEKDNWEICKERSFEKTFDGYLFNKKHKNQKEINAFIDASPIKRFRTAYRKPKEEELLKQLRELHVGKEITDVIDDGEIICIEFDHEIISAYNNILNIGYKKNQLDEIGE